MSKRKFGFEGFGISKRSSFDFEASKAQPRLYLPPPSRKSEPDNLEDRDLDNIQYEEEEDGERDGNQGRREGRSDNAGREGKELYKIEDGMHGGEEGGSDEIDPLDAFMEGIHEEVKKAPVIPRPKVDTLEDEEDDPMESFAKARRDAGLSLASEALRAGYDSDEEVYAAARAVDNGMVEYDSDDNPIVTLDRKKIEPLPQLDHSDIDYPSFNKDFYEESASISGMSDEEVTAYRQALSIKVNGFEVPRPVKKFEDLGFDAVLLGAIAKQHYESPTPVQCQALPVILSGRDVLGVAKTGSGKTAAFVLPMMVHIMDQAELDKGEGPIGVICAPTRELAQQIYSETKKFAKVHGIRVSGVYGGMSKFEQFKELKAGCEIVVATPGRLIDMLKMKAVTMFRATYLVLDEADRMFDLGFEPQIRSILGQMRPDRQTMLFSATMPKRVERLAREVLTDPVRVTVGEVGRANEDISQIVTVISSDADKMPWLLNKLPEMVDDGDTLVFASTKVRVEEVEGLLREKGFRVAALHGDKDQSSRMDVLKSFKTGVSHVLVATDVAARGLDIKSIKTVVNFDIAKDMDSHVHRIGRTGRAGDKDGVAHTLVTQKEARFAAELVNSLIAAGQNVPVELMDLAMKDGRFRSQREGRRGMGGGKGKGRGRGRAGGGGGGAAGGGGAGRSVRGVDFGLGIGYNPEAANKFSTPVTIKSNAHANQAPKPSVTSTGEISNRGAAVDALKVGMMARFKNSFVAASTGGATGSGSYSATGNQQGGAQNPSVMGHVHGNAVNKHGSSQGLGGSVAGIGFVSMNTVTSFSSDKKGGQDAGWNRGVSADSFAHTAGSAVQRPGGSLGGFVAAGTIGGPTQRIHNSSTNTSPGEKESGMGPLNHSKDSGADDMDGGNDNAKDRERSRWDRDRGGRDGESQSQGDSDAQDKPGGSSHKNSKDRERTRERRRPSGWDR